MERALSKDITSNSMPNTDPINIDLLRDKHPETANPDRDPVSQYFRTRSPVTMPDIDG